MKISEFQGFTLGCVHDLELLPVIDFTYAFRCARCGGMQKVVWLAENAGMTVEQIRDRAAEHVRVLETVDLPEIPEMIL